MPSKKVKIYLGLIVVVLLIVVALGVMSITTTTTSHKKIDKDRADSYLLSQNYTVFPLFKKDNLLYFKGSISDHSVYYLLDTGLNKLSIFADGIESLNLTPVKTDEKSANMTGQTKNVEKVDLQNVVIGNVHIKTISAGIMLQPFKNDEPTIVVGNDFLNRHHVIVDLQNRLLYLHSPEIETKTQKAIMQHFLKQHYQLIPLTKLASNHYLLPIQLNQASPVYFLFDTGTGNTTISDAYRQFLKLQPTQKSAVTEATDGTIETTPIQINQITYNPLQLSWQSPIVSRHHKVYSANIDSLTEMIGAAGVLGLAEMETVDMIIDLSTDSIFVKAKV